MAVGKKTGGRLKGSVNKTTKLLQGRVSDLLPLAEQRTREILEGKLPCQKCHGSGKTKYQAGADKVFDRRCESCYGEGLEKLSPDLIWKATLAVRRESIPELKAIEHSGPEGGEIPLGIRVISVKAGKKEVQ